MSKILTRRLVRIFFHVTGNHSRVGHVNGPTNGVWYCFLISGRFMTRLGIGGRLLRYNWHLNASLISWNRINRSTAKIYACSGHRFENSTLRITMFPCKQAVGNMRTVKAQIRLCIRAVYSGPDNTECFNGEQMPEWDFAHVQDDINPGISLDAVQFMVPKWFLNGWMKWYPDNIPSGQNPLCSFLHRWTKSPHVVLQGGHNLLWNFLQDGHNPLRDFYKVDKIPSIRWTKSPSDKTPLADYCHSNGTRMVDETVSIGHTLCYLKTEDW